MVASWLVLAIAGLLIWGGVAFVRKVGARNVLLTCLLGLPLLAVAGILLSLVTYRTERISSGHVESMQQINQQQVQRTIEYARARAEKNRRLAQTSAHPALTPEQHEAPPPYIIAEKSDGQENLTPPTPAEALQAQHELSPQINSKRRADTSFNSVEPTQWTVSNHQSQLMSNQRNESRLLFMLGAIFFMLGLAVMIGIPVYLAAQGGSLQWRDVASKFLSIVWIVPALAVAGVPLWLVGVHLSQPTGRMVVAQEARAAATSQVEPQTIPVSHAQDESGLPQWVLQPPQIDGDTRLLVVSSGHRAAVDDSETQAAITQTQSEVYDKALMLIRGYFNEAYPIAANWPVPDSVVRSAYGNVFQEVTDGEFGSKVYRRYVQVNLTPEVRERLLPSWQAAKAQQHLIALCTALGVVTLLLGTSAAYLRLDGMTQGAYRGRLKLASLSLITAGSLIAGLFLS